MTLPGEARATAAAAPLADDPMAWHFCLAGELARGPRSIACVVASTGLSGVLRIVS